MAGAVVLFSGGQDSTTCLYWALAHYAPVWALGVAYGQLHIVETQQAALIAAKAGVPYTLLQMPAIAALGPSALTDAQMPLEQAHPGDARLPASFVPGRNLILLSLAAAYAYSQGAEVLVAGMCEVDSSGYPDCRRDFLRATEASIGLALDKPLRLETPLLQLSKAEIWRLAQSLGCLETVIHESHSCYRGDRSQLHAWGYGCGTCAACMLRAAGWQASGLDSADNVDRRDETAG